MTVAKPIPVAGVIFEVRSNAHRCTTVADLVEARAIAQRMVERDNVKAASIYVTFPPTDYPGMSSGKHYKTLIEIWVPEPQVETNFFQTVPVAWGVSR